MKILFGILFLITTLNIYNCLQFTDCGSKVGKFTKIIVSDCDTTKTACILKRNTTASITIDFTLAENVKTIKTIIHGKIMGVEVPFHLENPDACQNSGLNCPLVKGSSYEYTAKLPVLEAYPKVSVEVKWELKDENNDDIICALIPAKIR